MTSFFRKSRIAGPIAACAASAALIVVLNASPWIIFSPPNHPSRPAAISLQTPPGPESGPCPESGPHGNPSVASGAPEALIPDNPPVEDPVLKDAEISDHSETDNSQDYESSKGIEDATTGKPFQGKHWNSVIGVGGGSGGAFGGRFGGRRNLRAYGGGRLQRYDSDPAEGGVMNTEQYANIKENPFLQSADNPLSTFSIDVDTASYSVMRSHLSGGALPPRDAIRIEELLNYFPYSYEDPLESGPFGVGVEFCGCPWAPSHRIARIGIKAAEVRREDMKPANLVFLVDVSGSMMPQNKLPLLVKALKLLLGELRSEDRVAIAVYAGASGLALQSTACDRKAEIAAALDKLSSGGSTNGGAGIQLAYKVAAENFVPGGVNRVILATDGDFNVGVSSHGELVRLIEEKAKTGMFLTVLGFGRGNYKDSTLESLADKGNGNYAYIDSLLEAKKVLVEQVGGTLVAVAKDVKIQVEFNPACVDEYRLIGYENRLLRKEDFNDDTKDAGEIGSGHTVTALYELVPAGLGGGARVDALKYQNAPRLAPGAYSGEALTVKIRYKKPDGDTSVLMEFPSVDSWTPFAQASCDLRFACAVASFGMLLRESEHKGASSFDSVLVLALECAGRDPGGYRAEFARLVERAREIAGTAGKRTD